jgi:Ribonuclease G/E
MTKPSRPPVREIAIHERIGELRAALFDRGRVVEVRLARWSTHETRARWGQRYAGRVTAIDPRLGGAFLDLGVGPPAFLPFGRERSGDVREGAALIVRVVREAEAEKGPALALEGPAPRGAAAPALVEDATPWHGWPGEPHEADAEEIEAIDAAIEVGLGAEVGLPGGGRLVIERTRALTAIDVDSAGRETGGTDPAKFARGLNLAAVPEIVRQIRVRGIGGLVCVDFTGPRRKGDAEAITKALESAFDAERNGGVEAPRTDVLPVSRFGIAEIARQKRRPSLADICLDAGGAPTGETLAIEGLDRLVAALKTAKGATIVLEAPAAAHVFLTEDPIGWRDEVRDEVGGMFELRMGRPGLARCAVHAQ